MGKWGSLLSLLLSLFLREGLQKVRASQNFVNSCVNIYNGVHSPPQNFVNSCVNIYNGLFANRTMMQTSI